MFPDMSRGVFVGISLTVGAGWNIAVGDMNLISSSKITSIREDDTTMALCIDGAIPSDSVVDISGTPLPARSLMFEDSIVMSGVASDESGDSRGIVNSSTLDGMEDPSCTSADNGSGIMVVFRSINEPIVMGSSNVISTRVGVTVEAESITGAIVSTTTFTEVRS